MTYEDKQHRRDDHSHQPYWQDPHQHDPYANTPRDLYGTPIHYDIDGNSFTVEQDPYGSPIRYDAYGNIFPIEYDHYGEPIPTDYQKAGIHWVKAPNKYKSTRPKADSDTETHFGLSPEKLQSLIAPANTNYKTNATDLINKPATPETKATNPTTPAAPVNDSTPEIPGLAKEGGKPIPQDIQDEFNPKLGKGQNLNHIRLFDSPQTHAQNDLIGEPGGGFSHGQGIYAGKGMTRDKLVYEASHHAHDLVNGKPLNRQLRR